MSVSATGGAARPLQPASNHSSGKRPGAAPADFPGVGDRDDAAQQLPPGDDQRPPTAARESEPAAPAAVSPQDAYAAHQLAKRWGGDATRAVASGGLPVRDRQELGRRFEAGSSSERLTEGPGGSGGVDVRA